MKLLLSRWLLVLISCLVAAGGLEAGLRYFVETQIPLYVTPEVDALGFEMRPGFAMSFRGVEWSINSMGYRDRERALKRDPSQKRIIFVGDSFVFGYAVKQDGSIPALLEKRLTNDSRVVEIWNVGVPAYNLFAEAHLILLKGTRWRPDLILWGLFENDLGPLPPAYCKRSDRSWRQRVFESSYLYRYVFEKLGLTGLARPETSRATRDERFNDDSGAAFQAVADWSRTTTVPVLVLLLPGPYRWSDYPHREWHDRMRAEAAAAGLPVHSLLDALTQVDPSPYLSFDQLHPNEAGSALYADLILPLVRQEWPESP